MADIKILNPDALGKPLGQYSHMTRVKASEYLFIAGQVAVDRDLPGNEQILRRLDAGHVRILAERLSERVRIEDFDISHRALPSWRLRRLLYQRPDPDRP